MAKDAFKFKENVSDFVNCFNPESDRFVRLMAGEHRTIQQAFTKLCLEWLEKVADEDYQTDGRNEASKKVASELIELWYNADRSRHPYILPSKIIPMI